MENVKIRIAKRLGILEFLQLTGDIVIEEKSFKVPVMGNLGYGNLHLSEPWMTMVLKKLKPLFNGYFVDIGVNVGQTLIKAYAVFEDVHYLGFEPNAKCVHYTQQLIKLNGFADCHILPIGISDTNDILKLNFFFDDDSDPSASLLDNFRPDQKIDHFEYVPIFDHQIIQKFLPKKMNTIVKIDVEGAELDVLKGIETWIQQFNPIILVEILPAYSENNQFRVKRQEEMETFLKKWDYQIFRLRKSNDIKIHQLESIGIHSNIEDSDYLLCPAGLTNNVTECFI